jgi:small subunit ribosomal protein S21
MTQVIAKEGESIDSLIRRFRKAVERSGVLSEFKKRQAYEKPSVRKKKKKEAAKKRALKRLKKHERYASRNCNNKNFRFNRDKTEKIPTKPKTNNTQDQNNSRTNTNNKRRNDNKNYQKRNNRNNKGNSYTKNK